MLNKAVNVGKTVANVSGIPVQENDGWQFRGNFNRNSRALDEEHVDTGGVLNKV